MFTVKTVFKGIREDDFFTTWFYSFPEKMGYLSLKVLEEIDFKWFLYTCRFNFFSYKKPITLTDFNQLYFIS